MAKPKLGELWEYQRFNDYTPHDREHTYHDVKKGAKALVTRAEGSHFEFSVFNPQVILPWELAFSLCEHWKKVKTDAPKP